MRRAWFLLLSLLILGVTLGLRQIEDTLGFIVPSNRAVLYATTFDAATYGDDWSVQDRRGGVTTIADGVLTLTFDSNTQRRELLRSVNVYPYGDFDLRVTASATAGPLDNSYGVVFRQLDESTYYLFYISSDGYYSVWRETPNGRIALSTWIPSDAIVQGADGSTENRLRVMAQGDTFRFEVNDTPLQLCIPNNPDGESTYTVECVDGTMQDTLTDDTIPYGQLGVAVETLRDGELAAQFDDVVVLGFPE